ncbi:MAG: hypothetical protein IIZ38_01240 [Sphingomonas sp.]|uniref:hypothetical protein n=1 Tax=unclassified Sphingomonas TaxID=196159 RepID=UPI0024561C38|nr:MULTISPECIES: hypothetical protein [unclassified Sphingomonas]MBQ1496916.1 hypothetical protein [Sphingomonas sp.]MDH4743975.1 hypothetical protein [Sphingomonas sp. CBMAI 2297]
MIVRLLVAAALLAGPAMAQDSKQSQDTESSGPPKRVRSILLYGQEECPKPQSEEEIVVCANAGESPYRIPKQFRNQPKQDAASQAWTNRVETVEEVNRAGLPNSCSPVGTGGQTGCTRQMIRQWYQERLDQKAKDAQVP